METFRPCKYTNAVYKTADSNSTLQMSNRVIVEHTEQMGRNGSPIRNSSILKFKYKINSKLTIKYVTI